MEKSIVSKSFFKYNEQNLSRVDAEFACPSMLILEEKLLKHNGSKLLNLVDKYKGPTINTQFTDEEKVINYIAIDSIDTEDGLTYPIQIMFKDRPSRAKYSLKQNDILVSNVRPNRGAVTLISKRNENNLASSGFTLLRLKESAGISSEFVFAFLKTNYGLTQLLRRNRGSMYPAVVEADVFDVWVPKPSNVFENVIIKDIQKGLALQDEFFYLHRQQDQLIEELLKPVGAPPSPLEDKIGEKKTRIVSRKDFFGDESALRFDADFFRNEYYDSTAKTPINPHFQEEICFFMPNY